MSLLSNPLIIGEKGMVGGEFVRKLPNSIAWDREEVDITNFDLVTEKLQQLSPKPSVLINCVAYNDVDGAEDKQDAAFLLNEKVVLHLAKLSTDLQIPLVHFSTGYVFDGQKDSYIEIDEPNPISVYGQSKLAGEKAVVANTNQGYIIRTNVVFGTAGLSTLSKQSFIDKILDKSKTQNEFNLVEDEVNSITYASDLVDSVITMLATDLSYGIYHVVNSGHCSWLELGQYVLKDKKNAKVLGITAAELPRPAKRPARVVLENTKLVKLRPWQEAVDEYLKAGIRT